MKMSGVPNKTIKIKLNTSIKWGLWWTFPYSGQLQTKLATRHVQV